MLKPLLVRITRFRLSKGVTALLSPLSSRGSSILLTIRNTYIYTSGQSRLYKCRKFRVHGTVSYVVFQNISEYDVLLLYTMDRFLPPRLMPVNV